MSKNFIVAIANSTLNAAEGHSSNSADVNRLRPYVERALTLTGWDLDRIAPTRIGPGLPWNYERRARELLAQAQSVLDVGTGGGELFAELCAGYHGRAIASEPWAVNAPIAKRRLSRREVDVVRAHSLRLPFHSGAFDLVLDRHEELDPNEVHRVLRRGGSLLTQQIGENEWNDLRPFFPPDARLRPSARSVRLRLAAEGDDRPRREDARHSVGVPRTRRARVSALHLAMDNPRLRSVGEGPRGPSPCRGPARRPTGPHSHRKPFHHRCSQDDLAGSGASPPGRTFLIRAPAIALSPARALHEAEQGPGPPGVPLHVHGARHRELGRDPRRCPRQDEVERHPRASGPRSQETRWRRDDARAHAPTQPPAQHEGLDDT